VKGKRLVALVVLVVAVAAIVLGARTTKVGGPTDLFNLQAGYMKTATAAGTSLLSFEGGNGWINTPPLTAADLRGKVVLVDFWTYSCVNWRRTLPYVRAWSEKYKDQGLVVVGVHTPEFAFEKDRASVEQAVKEQDVPYPVVLDSDYRIWKSFDNQYWPAVYLIDAKGKVRYFYPGEGEYAQTEREIQKLLAEAGHTGVSRDLTPVKATGAEVSGDAATLRSPETYVGYDRAENFAGSRVAFDKPHAYEAPARLRLNGWALAGDWTVGREYATSNAADATIGYAFHARDANLIMGSAPGSKPLRFRVTLDGHEPGADHGVDVDAHGVGTIVEPRMYQLIRQQGPIDDRRLEIRFLDPGARAYDFTFG
jgi:thiol-disulfide isomerase/thioredoxin